MNKHQAKGVANEAAGEVKQQVGKLTGDKSTQVRGAAQEIKGKVQKGLGDAKESLQDDRKVDRSGTKTRDR